MLNKVFLIGRLTRDPELRYTQSGTPVTSFTLAVDRPFTSQEGQRETDFIDCVAWKKLGETISSHLSKGRLVGLEGSLRIRTYDAQDGKKRRVSEVVADNIHFLDRPKETGITNSAPSPNSYPAFDNLDLDDDVPF
jgi:single-strand DNA-binding protein